MDGHLGGAIVASGGSPHHPAIGAGREEEDLAASLTPQVEVLRSVEHPAQEDGEQDDVPDDADRPGPDPTTGASEGRCQSKQVPDDLAPQNRLAQAHIELSIEQGREDIGHSYTFPTAGGWSAHSRR